MWQKAKIRWAEFRIWLHSQIDARWSTWRAMDGGGCACGWQQSGSSFYGTGQEAVDETQRRFWEHVDDGTCPLPRDRKGNLVVKS